MATVLAACRDLVRALIPVVLVGAGTGGVGGAAIVALIARRVALAPSHSDLPDLTPLLQVGAAGFVGVVLPLLLAWAWASADRRREVPTDG